jgi:nitroreductase
MRKPAPTDEDLHPLVRERWSRRAFSKEPVSPVALRTVFEAARWAPSSFNEQPWRFLVATRDDVVGFASLFECLAPSNQRWAGNAGALALAATQLHLTRTGEPNRHAGHDLGIAVGFVLLQATALGVATHPMAGFDVEKARAATGLPAGIEPLTMIALAMPGDPDSLPEDLQKRELAPRLRRPLAETVFGARWGSPAPFLERDPSEGRSS